MLPVCSLKITSVVRGGYMRKSLLPNKGNGSPIEGKRSGGFYTPHPLTEEQKSRFLKYRMISMPFLSEEDRNEILRLETELKTLHERERQIKEKISAIKHKHI
jgi:hypothetical protein